jgi:hypothetical protein
MEDVGELLEAGLSTNHFYHTPPRKLLPLGMGMNRRIRRGNL